VAAIVFVAAFVAGRVAVGSLTRAGYQYYQSDLRPAVLMACGHRFVNPPRGESSAGGMVAPAAVFEALASIFSQQRDSVQCSELPVSFTGEPPNLFQGTHRYLMMPASAVWMVTCDVVISIIYPCNCASHYAPLNVSPLGQHVGGRPGDCPVTERLAGRLLRLPFFTQMTKAEQSDVIRAVSEYRPS